MLMVVAWCGCFGFGGCCDDDRKTPLYRRHNPNWHDEDERQHRKSYLL